MSSLSLFTIPSASYYPHQWPWFLPEIHSIELVPEGLAVKPPILIKSAMLVFPAANAWVGFVSCPAWATMITSRWTVLPTWGHSVPSFTLSPKWAFWNAVLSVAYLEILPWVSIIEKRAFELLDVKCQAPLVRPMLLQQLLAFCPHLPSLTIFTPSL